MANEPSGLEKDKDNLRAFLVLAFADAQPPRDDLFEATLAAIYGEKLVTKGEVERIVRETLPESLSGPRHLVLATQALRYAALRQWEGPLLRLLCFCTRWTEGHAREVVGLLREREPGENLPRGARAWLDTINRKSVLVD